MEDYKEDKEVSYKTFFKTPKVVTDSENEPNKLSCQRDKPKKRKKESKY